MHLILMQGLRADPVQACKIFQGLGFRDLGCRGYCLGFRGCIGIMGKRMKTTI